MAAGLGYKEFTTGDVLTAADANGYLASQVVMVFASAAARTSAIASPQEGMISYLKDTNSTEYYSGSAWAALGGSSASYTQISSTNIAGAGTSISSIAGTYNKLVLVVQDWYPSTSGENLRIRFNGDATAGAYGQAGVSNGTAYSNAQTYFWGSYQGAINSDNNNFMVLEIENYSNTNSHKVATYAHYYLSGTTQMIDEGAMRWKNTSAITSIDFASTSGNLGQGTAILWGVK
jgi:hypothetical protein